MKIKREYFLIFLILLSFSTLFWKIFSLQVIQGKKYSAFSSGIFAFDSSEKKSRGEVFFSGGEPLAVNKEIFKIIVAPEKVKDKEKTAKFLEEVLGAEKEKEIFEKLKKNEKFSFEIEDEELVEKIKESNIEGVFFDKKEKRVY